MKKTKARRKRVETNKTNKIQEKEMELLRDAIKEEELKKSVSVKSPIIKTIFLILEKFLREKKLVCYGGTAINNILPKHDQFYDRSVELPDYDFFTPNAINDAKELADIYYKNGFDEVEAKSGIHTGTYKVYVNFIPIADITQMDFNLFEAVKKNAVVKNGIFYAPPNYLRMAAYLELSRPDGDISRWEKVWKRLSLLNKNYPIKAKNCDISDFTRKFDNDNYDTKIIYKLIVDNVINQGLVFFGGYALFKYSKFMSKYIQKRLTKSPDFDVLSNNPLESANIIKKMLIKNNIQNITIHKHEKIGEIIPEHYEIRIDNKSVISIYKTIACHSYNSIKTKDKTIKIASIDTMLSLYLAFLYANRDYYDTNRILCISEFLFLVQMKNRLSTKGITRRFPVECYGKQDTMERIRANKAFLYNELKDKPCNTVYNKYFLRYVPSQGSKCEKKINKNNKSSKNKTIKKVKKVKKIKKKTKASSKKN